MNYIYAVLLLHSAGKPINEENIKSVISSTGESVDDVKVKALVSALEGVDIAAAISKSVIPTAAATPVAGSPAEKTEKVEEEKKKPEEAAEGLSALFG